MDMNSGGWLGKLLTFGSSCAIGITSAPILRTELPSVHQNCREICANASSRQRFAGVVVDVEAAGIYIDAPLVDGRAVCGDVREGVCLHGDEGFDELLVAEAIH